MGGDTNQVSGPDLKEGIAPSTLREGSAVVGHVEGEAVLLVRRGSEFFAVGATCTHYGGPLAEGLVTGDEVRCPWHHACFSLRSGQAVRAPALNPVACYDVAERDGKLVVLGKRPPAPQTVPRTGPSSVVIVGAGAGGNACAEGLRQGGYAGPVTMIGEEETLPVDRPNLSKDYLAGNAPEEWIPLRGGDFYRDRAIDARVGVSVAGVEPAQRTVLLGDGTRLAYGALVLATGAAPTRLPIPGADAPHVLLLRTLADSRAIIGRAAAAKRVVVVGAGFIGLEVAASLRARGLEVHVVAPDALPLARVLGDALGAFVKRVHEEHGVTFHLETTPAAIEPSGVRLAGGGSIPADFVVMGAGVKPRVSIAQAAGLTIDNGIVVDAHLRTSAPDVWAVGDVARWPDARTAERIRVEHWVVAERMGQIAAKNILGEATRCSLVPFFWSAHYDATIHYVGHARTWDRVDISGSLEARDAAVAFRRAGQTLAVATIGRDRAALDAEAAMEQNDEAALLRLVPG